MTYTDFVPAPTEAANFEGGEDLVGQLREAAGGGAASLLAEAARIVGKSSLSIEMGIYLLQDEDL